MRRQKILSMFLSMALILSIIGGIQKKELVSSAATDYGVHNPVTDENETVTWDCVYFGSYWQNDTNGDGLADQNDEKKPIKWRVLSVDGDDAFLLADQILDIKQYNDKNYEDENGNGSYEEEELVTWENSKIRAWLNNEFLQAAFTEEEKNAILSTTLENEGETDEKETSGLPFPTGENTVDKVYLPSRAEMNDTEYGMSSSVFGKCKRLTTNTEYAKQVNSSVNEYESEGRDWWLRAPRGYQVTSDGVIGWGAYFDSYIVPIDEYYGIRPALHLKLSDKVWSKTDSISVKSIEKTYNYQIDNQQITLYHMSDSSACIKIGDEKEFEVERSAEQIGLGRDGMFYCLGKEDDIYYARYGTNMDYEGDKFNAADYLRGLNGSGICYFLTEDGLDTERAENVEALVYDAENFVVGYKMSDGRTIKVLSYVEMKEMEKKNESDVSILQKIIKEQKALGATVKEDIDDEWSYRWNQAGRLISIDWDGDGLSGSLNLQNLPALKRLSCKDNELTNLDVSKNMALTRLDCSNNKLNTLNVNANTKLESLDCCLNDIANLDLSKNVLLEDLCCGGEKPSSVNVGNNSLLEDIGTVGAVEVKGNPYQVKKYETPSMAGLVPKYYFNFDFNLNGGYRVTTNGRNAQGTMPVKQNNGVINYRKGKHGAALYLEEENDYGVELPVSNLGNSYTISFWYKGNPEMYSSVLFAGTDFLSETKLKWLSITKTSWLNGVSCPIIWSRSVNQTTEQYPWYGYQNSEGEWKGAEDDPAANALEQGEWAHIILTVDDSQTAEYGTKGEEGYVCSSKATTYINGKFFGTGTVVRDVFGKDSKTFLGINPWDYSSGGRFDDIAFFDQTVTAEQAQKIYECASDENKVFSSIPENLQINQTPPSDSEQNSTDKSSQGSQSQQSSTVHQQNASVKSETKISKPAKVNKVKASASKTKVSLNWKKVKGAKGYEIQYSTSKKWKGKKTKRTSKTKYTVKGLKKNKTYYFRVRAYKLDGKKKIYGKWSTVKKVKIKK